MLRSEIFALAKVKFVLRTSYGKSFAKQNSIKLMMWLIFRGVSKSVIRSIQRMNGGMKMNKIKIFKKVTGKCVVKGCRSNGRKVDTFYVSASDGFGPSVIICAECIKSLNAKLEMRHEESGAEDLILLNDEHTALMDARIKALEEDKARLTAENEKLQSENEYLINLSKTPAAGGEDAIHDTTANEEGEKAIPEEGTTPVGKPSEAAEDKAPEGKKTRKKKAEDIEE